MLSFFFDSIIARLIDLGFLAAEAIPEKDEAELARKAAIERVLSKDTTNKKAPRKRPFSWG
jgi:hypothetical protein